MRTALGAARLEKESQRRSNKAIRYRKVNRSRITVIISRGKVLQRDWANWILWLKAP